MARTMRAVIVELTALVVLAAAFSCPEGAAYKPQADNEGAYALFCVCSNNVTGMVLRGANATAPRKPCTHENITGDFCWVDIRYAAEPYSCPSGFGNIAQVMLGCGLALCLLLVTGCAIWYFGTLVEQPEFLEEHAMVDYGARLMAIAY